MDNKLINPKILLDEVLIELERQGLDEVSLIKAKEMIQNEEVRKKLLEASRIDKDKIEKATEIKTHIQSLTNDIVSFRYIVNEASKIMGKRLFEDNTETSRIGNQLSNRQVIDQDTLHIFVDDLHKYIVQSGNWKKHKLENKTVIKPCLHIITIYRNNFNHIYDMKGTGSGTEKAYKKLGEINESLIGHRVVKINEFPSLHIEILEIVRKMLNKLEENIEEWLK